MKTFVFVIAVFPLFLVSCAHKQSPSTASVTSDVEVSASLEDKNQGMDQPESQPDDLHGKAPSNEVHAIDDTANDPDDDLDDELDDDWEEEQEVVEVSDPLIYWNKAMFHVNDKLYFWVLKPVSTVYKTILPETARIGVKNFFHNMAFPIRFMGCVLQGKGVRAQAELARFMFNSTFGVLGFGNPAKQFAHLNPPKEDLGQAFGKWGIGNGFYIVWPFFGPSTLRDTFGMAGEYFLSPVSYVEPAEDALAITASDVVNNTSLKIGDYEAFKKAALDPYASMRDGYIQNRRTYIED